MAHEVTIGGERLGSGSKMKAYLHEYERSTHDTGSVFRSTMASGTLVPFMVEPALPGDTHDINLQLDVMTHPTTGPLLGSYKVQLDVFQIPIRLYQGKLHMNMLGIGMDMSKVLLPRLQMAAPAIDKTKPIDNQHINPSCIFSYLNIRGLGYNSTTPTNPVARYFNAVPYLAYWDIYKNYYANKQEEIGAVIHQDVTLTNIVITNAYLNNSNPPLTLPITPTPPLTYVYSELDSDTLLFLTATGITSQADASQIKINVRYVDTQVTTTINATQLFSQWNIDPTNGTFLGTTLTQHAINNSTNIEFGGITYQNGLPIPIDLDTEPKIVTFPLSNIDEMRKAILAHTTDDAFTIGQTLPLTPYNLPFQFDFTNNRWSQLFAQEGLALKTYNSDLFNNWMQTDWIDGPDGITAITAIDTSSGSFTIDELNLSKKIYDMLNRIAISGGSYDDWLDAVYTHERQRSAENPMYVGGLQQSLVFQEIVSNTGTKEQPLGTLAGKGRLAGDQKGGNIIIKVDEPSYIMGIVSITPRIDYSQGNKWDVNLKSINDFHKPALDQLGFQDLITDQMAWWDTGVTEADVTTTFKSAGKQPAWVNYMTNVNYVRGNFADQMQQMFMVLNRRYDPSFGTTPTIADLTTYIDPTKFNHIFADTRRDAQNFWVQIAINMTSRRKMSAKIMPNL